MGGMNITHTVEGRERYPVNLRYGRELRDNLSALRRVLVATPTGAQIPIGQGADLRIRKGPPGVGFIALAGVSAELGVVMLTYLDQALEARRQEGRLETPHACCTRYPSPTLAPLTKSVGDRLGPGRG